MGDRGPAPLPSVLAKLRGNPGKRKLNENEPKPAKRDRVPCCPRYLSTSARRKWRSIAPKLRRMGVLTGVDVDALALYCEAWSDYRAARDVIESLGVSYKTKNKSGSTYWAKRPEVGIAKDALATLHRLGREFGLTPSSRTRIQVGSG